MEINNIFHWLNSKKILQKKLAFEWKANGKLENRKILN